MRVRYADGAVTDGRTLCDRISAPFVFETLEHSEICWQIAMARSRDESPDVQKTLANIYKRSLGVARAASAIQYLRCATEPRYRVVAVQLCEREAEVIRIVIGDSVEVTTAPCGERCECATLLRIDSLPQRFRLCVKVALSHAFRLRRSITARSPSVLRSWVEISLSLFPDALDGVILVYPFAIKAKRQLDYLRLLRSKNANWTFEGYPYSIVRTIAWLISGGDLGLARLEADAAVRHGDELVGRYSPTQVATTDEFEVASFALNDVLRSRGVAVVNRAHGVGKYSPFVSYDRFFVWNEVQREFYEHFNPGLHMTIEETDRPIAPGHETRSLVFIDQTVTAGDTTLDRFQRAIVQRLKRVADECGFKVLVKVHPNNRGQSGPAEDGVSYVHSIDEIPRPALFFTIYSTAYLTFADLGATYLVEGSVFDPRLVFGRSARIIEFEKLEEFVRGLKYISSSSAVLPDGGALAAVKTEPDPA